MASSDIATDNSVGLVKKDDKNSDSASVHAFFEHCPVPYIVTDTNFKILRANYHARVLLGANIDQATRKGAHRSFLHLIIKDIPLFELWVEDKSTPSFQATLTLAGRPSKVVIYHEGVWVGSVKQHQFILQLNTQPTNRELQMYRMVYQRSGQAIYITDVNRKIIAANSGFIELFGYQESEVVGESDSILFLADEYTGITSSIEAQTSETPFWHGRVKILSKDANMVICNLNVSAVEGRQTDETSSVLIHILENIEDQLELENMLKSAALRDDLTGLYNRAGFNQRYRDAFAEAQRNGDELSLLFIDLDNFKQLNDQYGHDFGDSLLKQVAKRIRATLSSSALIGRLGGDEFIVMLSGALKPVSIGAIAGRLIESLSTPFDLNGITYDCTASIGVARYPSDAITPEQLLKCSDSAMYTIKNTRKNAYAFYDSKLDETFDRSTLIKHRVKCALEERRIKPFYQSIQNMVTGEVFGFECLVRMIEDGEPVSPGEFLPVIASDDLMVQLGKRLFSDVVHDINAMQAFGLSVPISINFSAYQLRSEELIKYIERLVKLHDCIPSQMRIEITETVIFEDDEQVEQNVKRLMGLGFSFVLDDFGTGHSSIYTLKKFNFSFIKIDKNFIFDVDVNNKSANLLSGIISLIKSLGLDIVCEGVEHKHQEDFLLEAGCQISQGFLYSKPMALQDVLRESFAIPS